MQKHNLTPTLLVGVGGTGVAVLRKFKRLYMEVNDEADQYIKLLAIDTDNQLQGTDPYLDNSEFLQLAKPDPIQVTDVLREARRGTKALEWLATMNLPAFEMHRGAGMKRLQGHLAYFWKGSKIRKQIEETMKPLLEANPSLKTSRARLWSSAFYYKFSVRWNWHRHVPRHRIYGARCYRRRRWTKGEDIWIALLAFSVSTTSAQARLVCNPCEWLCRIARAELLHGHAVSQ